MMLGIIDIAEILGTSLLVFDTAIHLLMHKRKSTPKMRENKDPYRTPANIDGSIADDAKPDINTDEYGRLRWRGEGEFVCQACSCSGITKVTFHDHKCKTKDLGAHLHVTCLRCGANHTFGLAYADLVYRSSCKSK